MLDAKPCAVCGETKPIAGFYADRSRKDGRDRMCMACRKADGPKRAAQRATLAAKLKKSARDRARYRRDPVYRAKCQAKARAQRQAAITPKG